MPTIETDRLILREYVAEDWVAVHRYASNGDILKYEIWGPNTPKQTRDFIQLVLHQQQEEPRRSYELAVTLKESGELIGGCGFRITPEDPRRGNFGYVINPDFWNRGYATEAARALIDHVRIHKGIEQVEATCQLENIASRRVLEKCGMRLFRRWQEKRKDELVWVLGWAD